MTAELTDKARALLALHQPGTPLLLANVWDVVTAQTVADAGALAIATSSAAVARAHGLPDNDSMPAEVAFGTVARIAAAVSLPVTADLEAGYQLSPADFVERLLATGAVGCNIEDSDHHGGRGFVPIAEQAAKLADIRRAADAARVPIVLNARVDVFLRNSNPAGALADGVERGRAYLAAGADCVYPITLADEAVIEQFIAQVGGNVNIMSMPGAPSVKRLGEMGVARISVGSGLMRVTSNALRDAAKALLES